MDIAFRHSWISMDIHGYPRKIPWIWIWIWIGNFISTASLVNWDKRGTYNRVLYTEFEKIQAFYKLRNTV